MMEDVASSASGDFASIGHDDSEPPAGLGQGDLVESDQGRSSEGNDDIVEEGVEADFDEAETETALSDSLGGDYSTWAAHVAGEPPKLEVSSCVLWEVAELPLGYENLSGFGPNGPPMNVLDYCPATERLFAVNQRRLHSFTASGLQALASGTREEADVADGSLVVPSQVNRLRCGRLSGHPVAVTVGAGGHVTVVPTDTARMDGALTLCNMSQARGRPTSTWGIAVAPHWSPDPGEVAVSGNDHCVKAWRISAAPPARFEEGVAGQSVVPSAPQDRGRCSIFRQWQTSGAEASDAGGRTVAQHEGNIPSVDLAHGRVLSASLDGTLRVSPLRADGTDPVMGGGASMQELASRDGGMWNVCWIPLRSISTDAAFAERRSPAASSSSSSVHVQWTAADIALPEEIISEFVLPLLGAGTLLRTVQPLSRAHARLAEGELRAGHRSELLALCLSERFAWLLDGGLRVLCRAMLPFNAHFAHAAYLADASAAVVATKMGERRAELWALTVLRRHGSLSFHLQADPLSYEHPEASPREGIFVGLAAAPGGRFFTLLASRRLACHGLRIGAARPQSAA